jgi:transposase
MRSARAQISSPCNRTRSRRNWYFLRVTALHRRCSTSGTKLSVNSRATNRFTSRSASTKSFFRPRCPRLYRRLLKMALEQLQLLEQQIGQLDQELATLLHPHQDAVQRLAEVPGLGVDSAQQIIAEVGPTAATFPSGEQLSSWVGACPGDEESAGVNYSHRSPKSDRHMRRLLNQAANAAVKVKGSIFEIIYRRCVPRLGHNQAIGLIAHRQCRLIWLILHKGTLYEERGPAVTKRSKYQRTWRMIRQLQQLGYRIESPNPQASQAQV